MIKFSSSFKLNEIHLVDSPFNEDPKFFSMEALISGEERPENVGKMGNNRDIYCYANRGWWISKENISPYSLVPNPCEASIFLHARLNFREKNEKAQFSGQNLIFL